MQATDLLQETTSTPDNVTPILSGLPLVTDGRTIGSVSLQREQVLDYKTKQPTGDVHVVAVIAPFEGRNVKVRWPFLNAAAEAIHDGLAAMEAQAASGDDEVDPGTGGDETAK